MKHTLLSLLLFACTVFAGNAQFNDAFTPDRKLATAHAIIDRYYVEDVDNDSIVSEAIIAMLKTLDPHSAYTSASETKEFTEPLDGKFSGIGIQFNMLEDTVYVIQTIPGGPSQKVGIMAGDRIVAANDTVLAGQKMPNTKVMKYLRGPKGSEVNLKVKRGEELIDFLVTRDDIPLYSIDETFMADPTTGYVRITRFGEDTPNEFRRALVKLQEQGMENLILDLSGNGGGYLGAAFQIASEFLPKGTPVVSTAGRRSPAQEYRTEDNGLFPKGRLVVITDQTSASASEILSGAIQDNDRGVVVGRRTFGKGLVQRPFPFPDGSMIRLTVSRYYTPSGRCIQKHYDKGHTEEYQMELLNRYESGELWHADSIQRDPKELYHTLNNKRPVYGGGGIIPDVFVPVDTSAYSPYYRDLIAKGVLNKTVIKYVENNRAELTAKYPTDNDFQLHFDVPQQLVQNLIDAGTAAGIEFNADQWDRSKVVVTAIMKGLMARDLYSDGSYYRPLSKLNHEFNKALEIINDPETYNKILNPSQP